MRFFLALEIPPESEKEIEQVQKKLQDLIPTARLTQPNKLHLTLAFIGEQPDSLKIKLAEILKRSSQGIPPFEITPAYIDGFPNIHQPHTIWIGVKGDIDKLLLLRERLRDELVGLNLVVDERRFTPHIAIAKINNLHIDSKTENSLAGLMAKNFEPIKVSSIKLFESVPEGDLHKHNTLAEISLSL